MGLDAGACVADKVDRARRVFVARLVLLLGRAADELVVAVRLGARKTLLADVVCVAKVGGPVRRLERHRALGALREPLAPLVLAGHAARAVAAVCAVVVHVQQHLALAGNARVNPRPVERHGAVVVLCAVKVLLSSRAASQRKKKGGMMRKVVNTHGASVGTNSVVILAGAVDASEGVLAAQNRHVHTQLRRRADVRRALRALGNTGSILTGALAVNRGVAVELCRGNSCHSQAEQNRCKTHW